MQPLLTELPSTRRITRTHSTARNNRSFHLRSRRLNRTTEEMLREIATVLHYTKVCRALKG
jgi:hypothetical protein